MTFAPWVIFLNTEPNEHWATNYMVFRYKAPITTIGRLVAVVAHHPIVIHLKDVWFAHFHWLELIRIGNTLIQVEVLLSNHHRIALSRDIDWSVVIACPRVMPQRIDLTALVFEFDVDTEHMAVLLEFGFHRCGQWQAVQSVAIALAVFFGNT